MTKDLYSTLTQARSYLTSAKKDLETAVKGSVEKWNRVKGFEKYGCFRSYSDLFTALTEECCKMERSNCHELEKLVSELHDRFTNDDSAEGQKGRACSDRVLKQLKLYSRNGYLTPNNAIPVCVSVFMIVYFDLWRCIIYVFIIMFLCVSL